MKRLVLTLLFALSFGLHEAAHAGVSASQHEVCAVSASPAEVPLPEPAVVTLSRESADVLFAAPSVVSSAVLSSRSARAPPR